jgi:hypothetical protein
MCDKKYLKINKLKKHTKKKYLDLKPSPITIGLGIQSSFHIFLVLKSSFPLSLRT